MSEDIDNFMPYLEECASNATSILELGPGKGTGSTLAFTRGLQRSAENGHTPELVSVDCRDYMELKPDVPWWHLIIGDSRDRQTLIKYCELEGPDPDIIYIDTVHTPEQVTAELKRWGMLARDHTLWLFHDTYMMGVYNPMIDAIKQYAAEYGWIYEDVFTEAHGLGSMHK